MRRLFLNFLTAIWVALGIGVATITVCGAFSGEARAQPQEPTAEQVAAQARSAQAAGRLADAIEGYARAYQLGGDPEMLFSMAEAHRQAGHDMDALRTFQTYRRRDPQGAHRDSADRQIKELDQKLHQGASASITPIPLPRPSGPAEATTSPPISPRAPARAPAVTPATPAALSASPPSTARSPSASPAPPAVPSASVSPPLPIAAAPPGQPNVSAPEIDLRAAAIPSEPSSHLPVPRWVPWTLAATTVALGTGAVIAGLAASNRFDELKSSCGQTAQGCAAQPVDDVRARARNANILWAATGIVAAATGVSVYLNASAAGVSGLWAF